MFNVHLQAVISVHLCLYENSDGNIGQLEKQGTGNGNGKRERETETRRGSRRLKGTHIVGIRL